jgi:hypothetical protein
MLSKDLFDRFFNGEVSVRQEAIDEARQISGDEEITAIVFMLIDKLKGRKRRSCEYAEQALFALGALAPDPFAYFLIKSRSEKLRLKLCEILGKIGEQLGGEGRELICSSLVYTANQTRSIDLIEACLESMVLIREQGLSDGELFDRTREFARSYLDHDRLRRSDLEEVMNMRPRGS